MSKHEDRIRERAYHLWEGAGRPHHRDAEFWHQASAEVAETRAEPQRAVPPEKVKRSARGGTTAAKAAPAKLKSPSKVATRATPRAKTAAKRG